MSGQSKMLDQTTLKISSDAIGSPRSRDGILPCASLGGLTPLKFGQALVPANLSARQAKDLGLLTSGIYGLHGSTSSASAGLQSFLVSRLKRRFDTGGWILFKLTWKALVTPSGRPYCLLRASKPRTGDTGCGSWPTAAARDYRDQRSNQHGKNARPLNEVAGLTSWPSPTVQDSVRGVNRARDLPGQTARGATSNGSPAETVNTGQLNADFSAWLMGYPTVWSNCADSAMLSSRKLRPSL